MKIRFLLILLICFLLASPFYGEIFDVYNVDSLRDALDDSERNGEEDFIYIRYGFYDLGGWRLNYEPDVTENYPIHICGENPDQKPIISNREAEGFLLDIDYYWISENNLGTDSNAHITIENLTFEDAYSTATCQYSPVNIKVYQANVLIKNCVFRQNNNYSENAGALYLKKFEEGFVRVYNNIFHDNKTDYSGGAVNLLIYDPAVLYFYNNTITGNYSEGDGGGAYIIYKLESSDIDSVEDDKVKIKNNIIWGNDAAAGARGKDLFICIKQDYELIGCVWNLWNNQIYNRYTGNEIDIASYNNNSIDDPLLSSYYYSLSSSSPCIDTGIHDDVLPEIYRYFPLDHNGDLRIIDGNEDGEFIIDRGAIEYNPHSDMYNPLYIPCIFVPPETWSWETEDDDNIPELPPYYMRINDISINSSENVGWTLSNKRTDTGECCLYYGNPDTDNYYSKNISNSGSIVLNDLDIKNIDDPVLFFDLYMDTEPGDKYDILELFVNDECVWQKNSQNIIMKEWQEININLQKFKGQTLEIKITFDTKDDLYNDTEGVYIQNLSVIPEVFIMNQETK